jgi:hypothetical protein
MSKKAVIEKMTVKDAKLFINGEYVDPVKPLIPLIQQRTRN